jgi:hypothetical protein
MRAKRINVDGRSKDGLEQLTVISDLFEAFGYLTNRSRREALIPGGNFGEFI